eukprot:g586.t1
MRPRLPALLALAGFLVVAAAGGARSSSSSQPCNGGACSSLVHYPVKGTTHYAVFNVPELPKSVGPTFFVYYNIDWQAAGPAGSFARMNQFVPQLMLGNPLDGSGGPPDYKPKWHEHSTWCFGAQYFFEIFNATSNKTEAHAATGKTYDCKPGEELFTEFTLSEDWVWTLRMGVVGDPSRVSTVVAAKPFMGLLPASQTSSWSEDVYSKAWSNTCWELYGIGKAENYPSSDMRYTINISTSEPGSIPWSNWGTQSPSCPGHPTMTISTKETPTAQIITWDVNRTAAAAAAQD